jgi:hypothetical protein
MMRYSSRLFLYGPVVLLLLIAAAVMVWWKVSATSFDARLSADNGCEIMPGVRMRYASKSMGGFPFRIDSVFDGFSLEVQTRTGPLVWRAEHFAMHTLTYGPNREVFEAAGTQTLSWTNSDGAHHMFTFVPGSLRASANMLGHHLARFDLDAVAINSRELSAARMQFHMRRDPGRDALDFVVNGDNLRLTSEGRSQLTQQVSIAGALAPAIPLAGLTGGKMDWRNAAESWRLDGGRIAIEKIEALQGRITASGTGVLSLDSSHRLQGRAALSYAPNSSQLAYVMDNGHVYYNAIAPKNIVIAPLTLKRTFFGSASDIDAPVRNEEAVRQNEAVVLHPLY